jgi:hypothetical protein
MTQQEPEQLMGKAGACRTAEKRRSQQPAAKIPQLADALHRERAARTVCRCQRMETRSFKA